tara:strand:- start:125 stop:922 length:798 start_codon:yes stop_codon:yes gene_type:complete
MKKIFITLLLLLSIFIAQDAQPYPPVNLVTIPTAGTLPKGYYSFENLFMKNGNVIPRFSIGISNNFTLGMSFGIQNFIGDGEIKKYRSYPEVQLKYRVYDENEKAPGVVIGIDTQGRGNFIEKYFDSNGNPIIINRYEQKSYGVYIVCSRNWQALGNFGLHVGINKNITEEEDRDDDLNLFFGFDKELNRSFSIFAEYNFARDDDDFSDENDLVIREGNGYLNAGLRWSATENLMLEINLNDFAKNNQNSDNINRELKVIYFEQF